MGDRLTHVEDRINQVEEVSARHARLLGYLLQGERQLEERREKGWNISQGGIIFCFCQFNMLLKRKRKIYFVNTVHKTAKTYIHTSIGMCKIFVGIK